MGKSRPLRSHMEAYEHQIIHQCAYKYYVRNQQIDGGSLCQPPMLYYFLFNNRIINYNMNEMKCWACVTFVLIKLNLLF